MAKVFYFSSGSGNTARFVEVLGVEARRIPIRSSEEMPQPDEPYVLICPTYSDGEGKNAVPKQVIAFLNDPGRRALLRGVIGAGNRNFGETYAIGGKIVARKCDVPMLTTFELAGTERDVERIRDGLERFLAPENACPEP